MIPIDVGSLPVGKKLARDIFDIRGRLLLPRGVVLKASHLQHLAEMNYSKIYVEAEDIPINDDLQKGEATHLPVVFKYAVQQIKDMMSKVVAGHIIMCSEVEETINLLYPEIVHTNNIISCLQDLRQRDNYTFEHSVAVSVIAVKIAQIMDIPETESKHIGMAGLLHDMGKCQISPDILNKPGHLSRDECELIHQHPLFGYNIVKEINLPDPHILTAVLQHHEHQNGKGYPQQIQADRIHIYSRIIAVADVFDALTSERFYRPRFSMLEALNRMKEETPGHLDPVISRRLIQYIVNIVPGQSVLLNTGEQATIIIANENEPLRPLVKTTKRFIDLHAERDISIENRV